MFKAVLPLMGLFGHAHGDANTVVTRFLTTITD